VDIFCLHHFACDEEEVVPYEDDVAVHVGDDGDDVDDSSYLVVAVHYDEVAEESYYQDDVDDLDDEEEDHHASCLDASYEAAAVHVDASFDLAAVSYLVVNRLHVSSSSDDAVAFEVVDYEVNEAYVVILCHYHFVVVAVVVVKVT
jgi:hypothetical protein